MAGKISSRVDSRRKNCSPAQKSLLFGHMDMDCFFCQVEVKLQPELQGKPLAVVQFNQWQSGGIIAVNYEARDCGVSRHMRPEEAKKKCPELVLATVPGVRGKADTSRYRIAGREVVNVLKKHSNIIERASVDEAYLDITELVNQQMISSQSLSSEMIDHLPNTYVIGYSTVGNTDEAQRRKAVEKWISEAYGELGDIQSRRLAIAGTIVESIRADVYKTTGYRCSAGVSYNKILAKLACGLHKPNRQTILPLSGVPSLYQTLPVKKVRNLGGKFGDLVIESLGCNVMADLLSYSLKDLQVRFDDKTGLWLYNIARGVDNEPVTNRLISKSIGSCKNFPGKRAIVTKETLEHWVMQLSLEMSERLDQDMEENNRKATLLTVSYHYYKDNKIINQSRSCRLTSNKAEIIMKNCLDIIIKFTKYPIVFMGMSASKFIEIDKEQANFRNFFKANIDVSNKLVPNCTLLAEDTGDTSSLDTECPSNETSCNNKMSSGESDIDEARSRPVGSECSKFFAAAQQDDKSIASSSHGMKTENKEDTSKIISPVSLLRAENKKLKPDNFKKSFFMNILTSNRISSEHEAPGGSGFDVTSCSGELSAENAKPEKNPNETSGDVLPQELQVSENFKNQKDVKKKDSSSINTIEPKELFRPTNCTSQTEESEFLLSNRTDVDDCDDNNSIKLQDIFPDLNNLDESVVAVLPQRLQREAKAILQSRSKGNLESKLNTVKVKEQKSKEQKRSRGKVTGQTRLNKIDSFFSNQIKPLGSSNDATLTEKCSECDKLIPVSEILEHADFHIARELSKEINKSLISSKVMTPEKATTNGKPSKRKRNKPESREPEKRSKGIAAFFS
ncbi:DNA polymerase eta isoform X1 [Athalia rosae]|uniref:DNA polymerase eta isoform X1 n=2 Tax=Athalia rosae TaxID=37344 RepID=UPI002033A70F|nr:DNA polymerase eta isoform X1 [Athalia rosae]